MSERWRCSRCKAASYCSPECQRSAWKAHKPVCVPPFSSPAATTLRTALRQCTEADLRLWANGLGAGLRYRHGVRYEECVARAFGLAIDDLEKLVVFFVERNAPRLRAGDSMFKYHPVLFPDSRLRVRPRACHGCVGAAAPETRSDAQLGIDPASSNPAKVARLAKARRGECVPPTDNPAMYGMV